MKQRFDKVLYELEQERLRVDEDKTFSSRCRLSEDPAAQASPGATTAALHPSTLADPLTYRSSTPPKKEESEQQPYKGYNPVHSVHRAIGPPVPAGSPHYVCLSVYGLRLQRLPLLIPLRLPLPDEDR